MRFGTWLTVGVAAMLMAGCARPLRPMQTFSDPEIQRAMRREQVQGLAVATIENGKVAQVKAFGTRNAALGQPLTPDTIMAGGTLTKAAFAYMLLQLADEGRLDLDAPVTKLLPHPLPTYRLRPIQV